MAPWSIRLAYEDDIPALERLIPLSARALLAPHYSAEQIDAALGPVFGVDRQLIRDGTYFVADAGREIVACGGWGRRRSLFGGDAGRDDAADALDPRTEPARIRAFFVHPEWNRRGLGRALLAACEEAIRSAGFRETELVATLAGEPLYAAHGHIAVERFGIVVAGVPPLPAVRMRKRLR
jgi:GNAT superfamily N-acetyltransferase